MKFSLPKGTRDILPSKIGQWKEVCEKAAALAERFGFSEIITPEFEDTALFERGVGKGTDIVTKEMYTFSRSPKESYTLKPEGTAPVIRAYIQNGMGSLPQPVKLFYITSCYRAENPQKGRQRQFHQFGAEVIGAASPAADCEVISLADTFLKMMDVGEYKLNINSVGCPECRSDYYALLRAFLEERKDRLCEDCVSRMELNPMRVFDCKNETCQAALVGAPLMLEHLCESCAQHFEGVKEALDASGIDYVVNPRIVRGLDYYTNTAFEFIPIEEGTAQSTLCAGGRYDGLCEQLGGESTPGVGFGLGLERLLLAVGEQEAAPPSCDLFVASLGKEALYKALGIRQQLIRCGFSVQTDMMGRSLKAQMKFADKIGAAKVLMIGEDEIASGVGTLRDMKTKEQVTVPLDDLTALTEALRTER